VYQVISESYERRSVISATNVESGRWDTVFADDRLAAAIVDRVVHHGRLVESGGPSHRLEESPVLGKGARERPWGSSRGRCSHTGRTGRSPRGRPGGRRVAG
jgi:hypothetical protein